MRIWKMLWTAVVVLAALLWIGSALAEAERAELNEGEPAEAVIETPGETAWFTFIPEKTGSYEWRANSDIDTYGYVYDGGMQLLGENNDGYSDDSFRVVVWMEAGETYILGARCFRAEETGTFEVRVSRFTYFGKGYTETFGIKVPYGEPAVLTACYATARPENLRYQWYIRSGEKSKEIRGATSRTYTVSSVKTREEYFCAVSTGGDPIETIYYRVAVDNLLRASASGGEGGGIVNPVSVPYGEKAALEVEATCLSGKCSYAWYRQTFAADGMLVSEKKLKGSGPSFTTPAVRDPDHTGEHYRCVVSDEYGNHADVYFSVTVDTGLRAEARGDTEVHVPFGEPLLLEVDATCLFGEPVFRWYREDDYGSEFLEGEDSGTLEIDGLTDSCVFVCEVSDVYGNTESVTFIAHTDLDPDGIHLGAEATVYVPYGTSVTLAVEVFVNGPMDCVSYRWLQDNGTLPEPEEIPGEEGNTLKTPPVTERVTYYCEVRYADEHTVTFTGASWILAPQP